MWYFESQLKKKFAELVATLEVKTSQLWTRRLVTMQYDDDLHLKTASLMLHTESKIKELECKNITCKMKKK